MANMHGSSLESNWPRRKTPWLPFETGFEPKMQAATRCPAAKKLMSQWPRPVGWPGSRFYLFQCNPVGICLERLGSWWCMVQSKLAPQVGIGLGSRMSSVRQPKALGSPPSFVPCASEDEIRHCVKFCCFGARIADKGCKLQRNTITVLYTYIYICTAKIYVPWTYAWLCCVTCIGIGQGFAQANVNPLHLVRIWWRKIAQAIACLICKISDQRFTSSLSALTCCFCRLVGSHPHLPMDCLNLHMPPNSFNVKFCNTPIPATLCESASTIRIKFVHDFSKSTASSRHFTCQFPSALEALEKGSFNGKWQIM